MDENYIVRFIKDKNHRRFNAHGVLTSINRGMFTLDFFEETLPTMERFEFDNDNRAKSHFEKGNLINYIQASVTVSPESLKSIIFQLQELYDAHIEQNTGE